MALWIVFGGGFIGGLLFAGLCFLWLTGADTEEEQWSDYP